MEFLKATFITGIGMAVFFAPFVGCKKAINALHEATAPTNSADQTPRPLTAEESARAQARAVKDFPELGVAGSPMNILFLARVKQLKAESSSALNKPDWPQDIAKEIHKARTSKIESPISSLEVVNQPMLYIGRWIPVKAMLTEVRGSSMDGMVKLEFEGGLRCEVSGPNIMRACKFDPSKDPTVNFRVDTKGTTLCFLVKRNALREKGGDWQEFLALGPGKNLVLLGLVVVADGKLTLRQADVPVQFRSLLERNN